MLRDMASWVLKRLRQGDICMEMFLRKKNVDWRFKPYINIAWHYRCMKDDIMARINCLLTNR